MLTLFKIDTKNQVVLYKNALKLEPEFKKLTQDQLRYMILAYDYRSKYHQWPEEERKRKAKFEVFGGVDFDPEESKSLVKCIEIYIGLQYDPKREMVRTYTNKIQMLNDEINVENHPTKISNLLLAQKKLTEMMEEIQSEIDRADEIEMEGDGKLSLIEKKHRQAQEMEQNLADFLESKMRHKKLDEHNFANQQVHSDSEAEEFLPESGS